MAISGIYVRFLWCKLVYFYHQTISSEHPFVPLRSDGRRWSLQITTRPVAKLRPRTCPSSRGPRYLSLLEGFQARCLTPKMGLKWRRETYVERWPPKNISQQMLFLCFASFAFWFACLWLEFVEVWRKDGDVPRHSSTKLMPGFWDTFTSQVSLNEACWEVQQIISLGLFRAV